MRILSIALAGLLAAPAFAAEPKLEALPDIPPPPGMVDQTEGPQITITQQGQDRVEEYRIKGRLYLIRVTPSHGKSYYLVDTRGDGQLVRYDDLSPNFVVPMWMIFEF